MRFVLALVSVVTPGLVLAQIPAPERQKIALALSGGSALGLAHIGVIEYFEEHHIPIDYITGTSMGALVGGFFASGTSASQLEQIALETDWNDLLTTTPRFVSQPVVEKQRWNKAFRDPRPAAWTSFFTSERAKFWRVHRPVAQPVYCCLFQPRYV